MTTSKPHIAVVGAGLAGLSCATHLHREGLQVSVFDKSRGPAGRMSTRRGDDWQCDHGAQYFTARHPDFRLEVEGWMCAGVAGCWPDKVAILGDSGPHVSDPHLKRFVGVPRQTAPVRFMVDALAQSVGFKMQTTVEHLLREDSRWQLQTKEAGVIGQDFDAVVLALPAPQSVPLLRPVAPDLAELANCANMRGSWALMLRFGDRVALPFDAAFVNHGPLRWIARDSSKPGRTGPETWLLHARAEWSEAHLEDDIEGVAEKLLQAFRDLGGPEPQAWTAHRWRYADTEPALTIGSAWDAQSSIGLCGDWMCGGKVEGAWLSGRELAQRIVASVC